ncbi:MAG: hypothetical protein NTV06_05095 [candidate division Zixibacteria bacterium]|nr:hypothetical protein [candidate division Zixibacteria bacterium]
MKKTNLFRYILVFGITLLAPTPFIFDVAGEAKPKDTELSRKEQLELAHNWQLAYRLADYDLYSWIATDTVLKYQDSFDIKLVSGWIVVGDSTRSEVIFGRLNDTCLVSPVQVPFADRTPQHPLFSTKYYSSTSTVFRGFKALEAMKSKHKKDFKADGVPMNSYVLFDADTISVYIFPGSTDKQIVFCGGYLCKYMDNNLKIIKDRRLHSSPLILEPLLKPAPLYRTSSKNNIMNEVDIAQFLIQRDRAPQQYVLTPKYIFYLSWDSVKNTPVATITPNNK